MEIAGELTAAQDFKVVHNQEIAWYNSRKFDSQRKQISILNMVLKNTRATVQPLTAARSTRTDLAPCTDRSFEESKTGAQDHWVSSVPSPHESSRHRGERIETSAAQYLKRNAWQVLATNVISPFAELDILAIHPDSGLAIIEVKSSFHTAFKIHRLGRKQCCRLMRARQWLEAEMASLGSFGPLSLLLLLVEGADRFQLLNADEFI